ncbi:MAG: hypothetical protein KDA74_14810, partial [Planctomycetaceae bacterium]|nr:hypothetical protein [Planctomycetaceae bacterium]
QQDKDAVRNAMNSFRDVANYSARMAIARHSLKHQRTDLVFKGILSGLCILFSLIIFGEAFWGSNSLGVFKWAALAVTIASTAQFLRGWNEARSLLSCKIPDETELTEENSEQTPPAAKQSGAQKFSLEALNDEVDSLSDQWAQLSAEEEQLQSLKADLFKKPGYQVQLDDDDQFQTSDSKMDQDP